MSECRSCHAAVVFAPSAKTGKAMILDAKVEKRIVFEPELVEWGQGGYGEQLYAKGETSARFVDVYVDHHATCPDAAAWKGKRR